MINNNSCGNGGSFSDSIQKYKLRSSIFTPEEDINLRVPKIRPRHQNVFKKVANLIQEQAGKSRAPSFRPKFFVQSYWVRLGLDENRLDQNELDEK